MGLRKGRSTVKLEPFELKRRKEYTAVVTNIEGRSGHVWLQVGTSGNKNEEKNCGQDDHDHELRIHGWDARSKLKSKSFRLL